MRLLGVVLEGIQRRNHLVLLNSFKAHRILSIILSSLNIVLVGIHWQGLVLLEPKVGLGVPKFVVDCLFGAQVMKLLHGFLASCHIEL